MADLAGKVALVTGGSRGIGEFVAEALVGAGVRVYISSRQADASDATAARLSAQGDCHSLPFDLADMTGVDRLVAALSARENRLDILVNNAGASASAPLDAFSETDWDRVLDLNAKAVFFLTQKLLPLLRAAASTQDPARVLNIGSIAGSHPGGGTNYSYKASKVVVHHLTRMLAAELGPEHITVNALAPGPFDTKMMEPMLRKPEVRDRILRNIPLGRVGSAPDISGVVLFLCQPAAAYITGAVIPLDGGWSAAR